MEEQFKEFSYKLLGPIIYKKCQELNNISFQEFEQRLVQLKNKRLNVSIQEIINLSQTNLQYSRNRINNLLKNLSMIDHKLFNNNLSIDEAEKYICDLIFLNRSSVYKNLPKDKKEYLIYIYRKLDAYVSKFKTKNIALENWEDFYAVKAQL